MNAATLSQLQQSAALDSAAAAGAMPGTWRLEGGRALTLRPREDGVLHIREGSSWLTFDGPHEGALNDLGDRMLGAGERVRVRAGQRLVIESSRRAQPVHFAWDVVPSARPVRALRLQAVAQSWDELQSAVALALRAGWRLAWALAGLAAAAPRPRSDGCSAM